MRSSRLLVALFAGALLLSACSGDGDAEPTEDASEASEPTDTGEVGADVVPVELDGVETAATFGDQEISGDQLRALVDALRDVALAEVPEENLAAAEADLVRGLLTQEIQVALVRAFALDEYGIEVSEDAVDEQVADLIEQAGGIEAYTDFLTAQGQTEETAREQASVQLLVTEIQRAIAAENGIDDAAIRSEYDLRASEGAYESSTVRHILLDTEPEAQDALERVEGGEDFSDVAMDVSTGPSAPTGGELGSSPRGQFVPEFEEAVWSDDTEIGVPVGPVETQFGFHVIVVDERSELPFEDVADGLLVELLQTRAPEAFPSAIEAAFSAVEIEVDPAIGVWDADFQSVVAAPA